MLAEKPTKTVTLIYVSRQSLSRFFFALGGLYADLEEALGKELDMITVKSLKYNDDDSFKNNLEKERVLIYEAA